MNLDNLNKWLTVTANAGVLIGIIFLSLQIGQSNRIAEREGRMETVNQAFELQNLFLENSEMSELMVKLSESDPNLSSLESIQAEMFAQQLILRSGALLINYESGFISDQSLRRQITGTTRYIRRFPGIAPFLEEAMLDQGIVSDESNQIVAAFWEEINRVE